MKKKVLSILLTAVMVSGLLTGCGNKTADTSTKDTAKDTTTTTESQTTETKDETDQAETPAASGEKDVVTALLPPVSPTYQDKLQQYAKDFNAENPNIELQIVTASWEDMTQKLDVQVNAGSPPDIAFIGSGGVNKYLDTGMIVDITNYATPEMVADYNAETLAYFKSGDGLYGFPAYTEVQAIGGNKAILEEAGIDWEKIQKEGWTDDEFREAIKKGVVKDGNTYSRYGFVFACSGVAARDYFSIMVKNAGMPSPFTKDLKYSYTSSNMIPFLEDIVSFIDDGSMPKELSSVDAGKRWNMFLTGQTMITGKGLSVFEKSATDNNKKIAANDGSAVEGSIEAEYIVLPVPTFNGNEQQAQGVVDGYVCFRGKEEPTDEHMQNVTKAAYFLASGLRAAETCQELYISPICKSGEEAFATLTPIEGKNEQNTEAVKLLATQAAESRPDIPADLGAKAIKIEDEVILPKFQGLLAGEVTPQEMYDAIKKAAVDAFGEDGCMFD